MDIRFSEQAEAFRHELRAWLNTSVPPEWRRPGFWMEFGDVAESARMRRAWEKERYEAGFAGIGWPVAYGGRGLSADFQAVHDQEMSRARAPLGPFFGLTYMGTTMLGPALMRYGTEEQKRSLLPAILSGETVWGQGFSEPDAGSDLASLRTTATRDGDHFVVSGQKVWTSFARDADALFALVRTERSEPRQAGVTFLLIDLTLPGVTVRPIRQMSGAEEFGEEFLDDVRVPVAGNVVGEVGRGWDVAKYLLSVERNASPMGHYFDFSRELADVIDVARRVEVDGTPALEVSRIRERIADCVADLELLRVRAYYTMSRTGKGKDLGAEASITKLHWSRTRLAIADLGAELLGHDGQVSVRAGAEDAGHLRWLHHHVRGQRIAGGTAQVQRTLVAQQLLGLPR